MLRINSVLPAQNGRHSTDEIFRCILVNDNFFVLIKISLKFVMKGPIDNDPLLVWDNGLATNRRHAIIWNIAGPNHWRIYAAPGEMS